ncbi:TonB-dependent receptor domain-containing protein [Marinicella sp. W31]|uniref:TonB-dependent receptor n=1 Tax=Marinicella sp. W31 TaxID=3023713 RepID=UPI0037578B9E
MSKQAKWIVVAALLALLPLGVVMAQETSSTVTGTIYDSDGNTLSGATVVVTHIPTGQTKTLTTNDAGRYSARNVRVGGPFNVEVRLSGYSDAEEDNIFTSLGEVRTVDAVLVEDAIALDTVKAVGVAAQSATFNPDNMGSGSSISQEQLTNLPTVDRDIKDFVRLDSRVNLRDFGNGISVSGVNNRFNNISIDGVSIGDPFGLEASGSPGLSQPFSLDTIQELNVQLSPYDVTLSNFTGANINAITKSGTNEFTGRFSVFYSDEKLRRDDADDFERQVYSVTFGGPIIKDKLFFFVAYEDESTTDVVDDTRVATADLQEILEISQNVWGFNPGSFDTPNNLDIEEESIVVKLDWNINDYHRASFKFQNNEDNDPRFPNATGSRASFSSHWYTDQFENKSYNLNLYSDWTANFSTEFRYSSSEFDKEPLLGARFPEIEVDGIFLGTERFRHANILNTETDNIYLEGEYFLGDHTLTFGVDYRDQDINNTFVFSSLGEYEFDSIEDYRNGAHSFYQYRIGSDPSNPFPAADWAWSNTGIFIQDNWIVNDRLTLQYGFRYDKPDSDDTPLFNQKFQDNFGLSNTGVIDEGSIQPRFGFNLDLSDEYYMQLRGGIGVFTGGTPNVWLSNSFTNPGGTVDVFRDFGGGGVIFTPDVNNQPRIGGDDNAVQDVDLLDPNFEVPTVTKSNIALDAELPWFGLIASTEFEYIKKNEEIFYRHLNLGAPTGTLPDGRLSYKENPLDTGSSSRRFNANPEFNDVLLLTSTDGGDIKRATFSLELPQGEHWNAKASYTYTDATDVSSGTSSRAISNWNNNPTINPNEVLVGTSAYEIENAFTMYVNYQNNFFGDTITNVGLVWISRDGEPFSYTYGNDVNGDGIRDNDLVYVPNVDEYVLSGGSTDVDAFEAYLRESGLDRYRGQIAPRNEFKSSRINTFDLNVSQELPAFGRVRPTLFLNIQNFGNMIDDDWGIVRRPDRFDGVNVYNLNSVDNGVYSIDWDERTRREDDLSENRFLSQWRAQVGFRLDW